MFHGLQDHTAETIKSFEGIDVAWIEEAQTISHRSLEILRPPCAPMYDKFGSNSGRAHRGVAMFNVVMFACLT